MTPVEELREAARLMRERANAVARHEDRWKYQEWPVSPYYEGHVACEGDPQRSGVAEVILGSEAGPHIASWHPAVALAVADWLDSIVDRADTEGITGDIDEPAALAVARAYLGDHRAHG